MTVPNDGSVPTPVVATVTMGYGHLRAAAALADLWSTPLEHVDTAPMSGRLDRWIWTVARRGYHGLSRLSQHHAQRRHFRAVLHGLTAIEPAGDTGRRPFSVRLLDGLTRAGFGRRFGAELDARGRPYVATFYANAVAAERHSRVPVALVVTDSDIHRVWAGPEPGSGRIHFLAPTEVASSRLRSYGVPPQRLHVTGFPLPRELIGSAGLEVLDHNLEARLRRLERAGSGGVAPHIVLAVGGAGSHAAAAHGVLRELRDELARGAVRLTLVAGTHSRIARRFGRWLGELALAGSDGSMVEILYEPDFNDAYRRFNRALAGADILWTKPSELSFYAALGLPLLLEAPVGAHEDRNRAMVVDAGAAADRPRPGEVAARLRCGLANGWFIRAAERGRHRLPATGLYEIASVVSRELYSGFTLR
jgi:hypothetical protein